MATTAPSSLNRSLSNLNTLLRDSTVIKMTRPYRGMLFTQDLAFIAIEQQQALFSTSRGRLLANPGDRIFLHSPGGANVFMAHVVEVDHFLGRLTLKDFEATGRGWAVRRHERVQPSQPTRVMLHCQDRFLPTFLENLSLTGVGLLAYKPLERGLQPNIGHEVRVEFALPTVHARMALGGRLVSVYYPGQQLAMLGVQTTPTLPQATMLERYITNRQGEIVDEIDQVIKASLTPPNAQDLYF